MRIDNYCNIIAAKMREAGLVELAATLEDERFFVKSTDVDAIMAFDPETVVLVRCINGRFTTPIKGLAAWLQLIRMECTEYGYLRDVCIPYTYTTK
jgi:hypothetical protein